MRLNTKFSDALHIMALLYIRQDEALNSVSLTKSVNTNPVVIRRIESDLKKAGLLNSSRGNNKVTLTKAPKNIKLNEIYEAVDNSQLLHVDEDTNPNCIVGGNIQNVLENYYGDLTLKFKQELSKTTLQDIIDKILQEAKKRGSEN